MRLGAPQIIVLVIYIISLGIHMAKHGEPQNTKYNFWVGLFSTAINIALLWWGGFFG